MRFEDYPYAHDKPLSPPLTLPLSMLNLPETGTETGSEFESDSDVPPGDSELMCGDVTGGEAQPGMRKDTLSQEGETTFGDLLKSEGARLSPLSPAWMSQMMLATEDSALLGSAPSSTLAHRRGRGSLVTDRGQPYKRNRSEPYATPASTWSPRSPAEAVESGHDDNVKDAECCQDPRGVCDPALYMPSPRLTPPRDLVSSDDAALSQPIFTPMSPWGADLSPEEPEPSDLWPPGPLSSQLDPPYDFEHHPFLPLLDIPEQSYHTPGGGSPDIFNPSLFDEDYSMEVDSAKSFSASSRPSYAFSPISPSSPSPFLLPSKGSSSASASYPDPLPPPCSPSISMLGLPDLSDDEEHPSSPCRRSFSSLPDLEMDDSLDMDVLDFSDPIPFPSPSPGSSLLSLPGAEADNDLLPPPLPNFSTSLPPQHASCSSQSLLFIDDPRDVPAPRSPSPEDFDLRIVLDDDSDPELAKLYHLRKKSLAAERAARHAEAQLIEAGSVCLRAEATKEKRKNKERSKEVGALLRIKLGDKVLPEERTRVATGMSGISQLVARMLFKRHETFRPLAYRKSAATNHDYVRSSLSRSNVAAGFSRADFA